MSLIKPKVRQEKMPIKIHISSGLLDEIKAYYAYSETEQTEDYEGFFEQAALYVLKKDTGFKKWKKAHLRSNSDIWWHLFHCDSF